MNESEIMAGMEGNTVPRGATQQPVRINYRDLTDVKCDRCGDMRFEMVYLIKRASPLVSPTGKEEMIPMGPPLIPPIFACYVCGHINEIFLPVPMRASMQDQKDKREEPTAPVQGSISTLKLHKDD